MMLREHRGRRPDIDDTATISPDALISGDVMIGPRSVVLAGAVVTAEGAPVHIGEACVVMENAVVRGAGEHPCVLGDHVLVGPHAHVSGATIGRGCFIATGAAVFNGAVLGDGTVVAVHGVVHIRTACPPGTVVPIGYIAIGSPLVVYSPEQAPEAMRRLFEAGFTSTVFAFDSSESTNAEATVELCERYVRALERHGSDGAVS
jgi:carbonic anhydrase/acetyltransferase-like protein (isoleucine patch superfamily)